MAKRLVYLGPFNNSKSEELKNMGLDYLIKNKGNKFYYLLPNGELLREYRRNYIRKVVGTFEINLFTFDDIVNNILKDTIHSRISESMKELLLKEILRDLMLKNKINYYKDFINMEGFIKSTADIIGEIKRSLISPEDYFKNSFNSDFYKEIGVIYEEYEKRLKKFNFIDREGGYYKSIQILNKDNLFFKDLDFIIIDEFYDFRPIEMAILNELVKSDIDIYINIPFDMKKRNSNLNVTIDQLKHLGFDIKYIEHNSKNSFEELAYNLFSEEINEFDLRNSINLIEAPTAYLELRRIFEEIKRLIKNGVNLNAIGLVILNEEYMDSLFNVIKEESIPITINEETPLISLPLVVEFLNIIENRMNNGSKDTVINRIKSNYFKLDDDIERDSLEYIVRSLDFKNLSELSLIFNSRNMNISMEQVESLKMLIDALITEQGQIPIEDTVENYNKLFIDIFNQFNIETNIFNRYKHKNNYELFKRDLSTLQVLREVFEDMEELSMIINNISLKDYYYSLINYMEEKSVEGIRGKTNSLQIFNPINIRGFQKDVLFVVGLSQADYPKLDTNNYFLNDYYYNELTRLGIDTKTYSERMNNEAIKFASIISSCKRSLYLSYSNNKDNNISSMFLDEVLGMLKGEGIEEKVNLIHIDFGYLIKKDIKDITNEEDFSKFLIYNYYNGVEDEDLFGIHNYLYGDKFKRINEKIEPEIYRSKEEFSKYSGLMESDEILRDIKNNIRQTYSISYLESYSRCPYYFMLNNLLEVKEMDREFEEYSPIDIGNVYHEVLRRYYTYYSGDITDFILEKNDFSIEETFQYLKEIVNETSVNLGFDLTVKKDLLIIDNIYEKLVNFINEDIKRLSISKEKLIPVGFEVSFGIDKSFNIEIEGRSLPLVGKIDRIDKLISKDKYVIMDYKSSLYSLRDIDHMRKGLSLQLPVYILSQEDKDIVAGIYGILSSAEFKVQLGILGETKIITGRHKGGVDTEEWSNLMETTKKNILTIVEGIEEGNFSVNPLDCSTYCIYKDICRYDKILEVE